MIKLMVCLKRNPNMTRDEFREYWLKHHGPLFQRFAETYKAVRYIQNHIIDSPLNENMKKSRGFSEEYDGIGEIWWESEEDFIKAVNSPAGQELRKMFIEDEARFTNLKETAYSCHIRSPIPITFDH